MVLLMNTLEQKLNEWRLEPRTPLPKCGTLHKLCGDKDNKGLDVELANGVCAVPPTSVIGFGSKTFKRF